MKTIKCQVKFLKLAIMGGWNLSHYILFLLICIYIYIYIYHIDACIYIYIYIYIWIRGRREVAGQGVHSLGEETERGSEDPFAYRRDEPTGPSKLDRWPQLEGPGPGVAFPFSKSQLLAYRTPECGPPPKPSFWVGALGGPQGQFLQVQSAKAQSEGLKSQILGCCDLRTPFKN